MPLQKQINLENLSDSSKTLDEIESSLNQIKSEKRTRSWTEKAHDMFTYLSYAALVTILLFILYKFKILELCSKCIPKLCVNICCPTNNVTNNVTPPGVVTYVRSAPLQDTDLNAISAEPVVEHHLVKLSRKNEVSDGYVQHKKILNLLIIFIITVAAGKILISHLQRKKVCEEV